MIVNRTFKDNCQISENDHHESLCIDSLDVKSTCESRIRLMSSGFDWWSRRVNWWGRQIDL